MIRALRGRLPAPLDGIWGATALLVLALCVVLAAVPSSSAAFVARVANTSNTAAMNRWFNCPAAMAADNAYYAYPLDDPNPNNLTAARDLSAVPKPGTYRNTATHSPDNSCFRDSGGSTTFDGTNEYVSTPTTQNNQQAFTLEIWFRTTTSSGALMGFSDSLLVIPTSWDRMIYLTANGRLTFGVYPGSYQTITSPLTTTVGYADGSWHHVMATLGASGMFLYVDGVQVATSANTAAQNYSGLLRIGYNYLSGWPGVTYSNYYFKGGLGHAAYYLTQLPASAAAVHYASGRSPS